MSLGDKDKLSIQYYRPNTVESRMKIELVTARNAPLKLYGYAQLEAITSGMYIVVAILLPI